MFTGLTLRSLNLSGNALMTLSPDILDPVRGSLRSVQIMLNHGPLTLDKNLFRDMEMDTINVAYSQLTGMEFVQSVSAISLDISGNIVTSGIHFSRRHGVTEVIFKWHGS